jgi:hypothetical protein
MLPVLDLDPAIKPATAVQAFAVLGDQALYMRDYMRKRRMTA